MQSLAASLPVLPTHFPGAHPIQTPSITRPSNWRVCALSTVNAVTYRNGTGSTRPRAWSTVQAVCQGTHPSLRLVLSVAQSMQSNTESLPVLASHVPRGHAVQNANATAPTVVLYVPAMHSMQSLSAVLPLSPEYFPATQAVQSESSSLPSTSTYVPAGQSMQ